MRGRVIFSQTLFCGCFLELENRRSLSRRVHQDVIEQKGRQTDVLRKKQREFRSGIIKQIHEKQEERINERRAKYQEGVKLEEEAKARRQRLEEAKIRKLNELRSVCSTPGLAWALRGNCRLRETKLYVLRLNLYRPGERKFGRSGQPRQKTQWHIKLNHTRGPSSPTQPPKRRNTGRVITCWENKHEI